MVKTDESLKFERKIRNTIIVDLIFSFLPVIVLVAIKLLTCSRENFFLRSDWSYISMILYGQTLIKLFTGIIQNMNEKDSSLMILQVSCILLFLVNKKSIKNSTEFQLSPTGIPIKRQHQGGLK